MAIDAILRRLQKYADSDNIAVDLSDEELSRISTRCIQGYETDKDSRTDWEDGARKSMDVAKQVRSPKNFPFRKASNVKYPLITVAALQFGARAYPAIVDGQNIVKGQPIGDDKGKPAVDPDGMVTLEQGQPEWEQEPGYKRQKAERIGEHMSYQLIHEMTEWEEDTDSLLHHIPIVGCAFRKVWRDPIEKRNRAEMVRALDLVVNDSTKAINDCPRITQKLPPSYPHEVEQLQRDGIYRDVELPQPNGDDEDAPFELYEQHCLIDLDEDGYREPYIVTFHKESGEVLRIVANYDFEEIQHDGEQIVRIPREQYFVKYGFLPDPDGGFYDVGFGSLLESLSSTIDSVINQMIDAGTLQNAGGGFIGSGVRLKKGQVEFAPGRYTQIEATGAALKDAIYNFDHPGPSATSFAVLELMLSAATDITGVKDIFTGDTQQTSQQTATTTLALIEQGMKVFTAIYKRIYRSLRQEFKLLFRLNSKYMEDEEYFNILGDQKAVAKQDYDADAIDVLPIADPHMVTDMQRLARAQAIMPLAEVGLVDQVEATRRYLERIGESEIDDLLPKPPQPDPVAEEAGKLQLAAMKAEVTHKDAATDKLRAEAERIMAPEDTSGPERDLKRAQMEADQDFKYRDAAEKYKLERDKLSQAENLEKEKLKLEKLKLAIQRLESQEQAEFGGQSGGKSASGNINIMVPNKKVSLNYGEDGRIADADIKAEAMPETPPETPPETQKPGKSVMKRKPKDLESMMLAEFMPAPEPETKIVRLKYNEEGRISGAMAETYDEEGNKLSEQNIDMEYQDGKLSGARAIEKPAEEAS